jgi:hypothetical protein
MPIDAAKALQYETDFLAGVEVNFEAAKGRDFRGSMWDRSEADESDRLRALLASNRVYDRERLKTLPANRRVAVHGYERRLWLWKRRTGVAIASVVSPLGHYASPSASGAAPPIGLGELVDHVRRLVGDSKVPHIVGVCSPSGFTDEARAARLETANATVVLIEPDGAGGWRTHGVGETVDSRLLRIFDPEGAKQKLDRVRRAIAERSTDLLTGGLSASSIARSVNLPEEVVRQGFEQTALKDPELRVSHQDGEFLLFRGAPQSPQEKRAMNVIDRIRQLFSREGDEAAKINVLAERRAGLSQRRDRIYEEIAKLEQKEADLFAQGKAATSAVPKRRLAAQIAQLRKDIARQNTTAAMLNQQINIISTDIHNLTLIQQGQMARLPDSAELTEHAVEAEELLETLKADAELVGSLAVGQESALVAADELAILKEFEEEKEQAKVAEAPPQRAAPTIQEKAPPTRAPERPESPAAREASRRPADAEPT